MSSRYLRAAGAALSALVVLGCGDAPTGPRLRPESTGGSWATWVLPEGSALRPAPPPAAGSAQTVQEVDEILRLQRERTAEADARIRRWDGTPTSAWTEIAVDLLGFYWPLLPDVRTATPARAARIATLLHVAMYDALIAAWDAKYTYGRLAPAAADTRVQRLVTVGTLPSYPSEHAVAAGAAAEILAYAFPHEDPARFAALAREAADSRVVAGAAYRSDVEAGLALGRAVAERVLERARQDGSDAVWSGTMPEGPDMWKPTPPRRVQVPFDPLAGTWRTWVIARGDAYRPAPPPALGSAMFRRDLDELRKLDTARTAEQGDVARYWATDAPSVRWHLFVEEEIAAHRLTTLRAARAHALASVAMYDAFVACWDAKFFYWLARPVTIDSTIRTVFSTPPFPSYPSGHSTMSSAVAEVVAALFPDRAAMYLAKAHEASESRVLGGVHYRFDITTGEELGAKVGRAVVEWARRDGSLE